MCPTQLPAQTAAQPVSSKPDRREPHRQRPRRLSRLIVTVPNSQVSSGFLRQVNRAVQSLPSHVRQALYQAGYRIVVCRFLIDASPELEGKTPRGWNTGTTWYNADGMFMDTEKRVVIAEYYWYNPNIKSDNFKYSKRIRRGRYVMPIQQKDEQYLIRSISPARLLRHEVGHAVDHLLELVSQSHGFKDTYMADVSQLNEDQKQAMYYFIQADDKGNPSKAGMSEAFAEAFASLHGGGTNYLNHFRRHFKHTMVQVAYLTERRSLLP